MRGVVFDLETASVDELHRFGPGFVRLAGYRWCDMEGNPLSETRITADPREMVDVLHRADFNISHNGIGFDHLALAKWYGASYRDLCRKAFDTQITEWHLTPVAAKGAQKSGFYGLDATAERYGAPGKTNDIRKLARKHGGFHTIPQDDPEYRAYLEGDIDASLGLYRAQRRALSRLDPSDNTYIRREHAVSAAMGESITLHGLRVDVDENLRRWQAGQERLEAMRQQMHERYGMPLDTALPHRTNLGKAAVRAALIDTGISAAALDANWPVGKKGDLLLGKEVLTPMTELFDRVNPAAAEVCRLILAMNGERTVYGTIMDCLAGDRVHPQIAPEQASGRWSMKKPGLTVLGKKGGKAVERGVILADSDDEFLVAIDFDQIDARGVAGLCGDPEYAKLFEPGRDLHSEVALKVFGREECRAEMARSNGRCDCEWREKAKGISHGWAYGLSINGIMKQYGVSRQVAEQFDRGMQKSFRVLCEWKEATRRAAGALGFDEQPPENDTYRILRNGHGRPVRVERTRAYTQATALLGQSQTRDLVAEAILNLKPEVRRRVRAVIHDEAVLSIPRDWGAEGAKAIADAMQTQFRGIPITAGVSRLSHNWAGCYGEQYERMPVAA